MISKASLKTKMMLAFGVILLALAANSLVGYLSIKKLTEGNETFDRSVEKRKLALVMRSAAEQQRAGVRGILLGIDSQEEVESGQRNFQIAADRLSSMLGTGDSETLFSNLKQASEKYSALLDQEVRLHRAGKNKDAIALSASAEGTKLRQSLNASMDALLRRQEDNQNAVLNQLRATGMQARLLLEIFAMVGLAAGVGIAVLVPRSLTRSISAMISVIDEVAKNNLSVSDLRVTSHDELGRASTGLNTMKNSLRDLIQSIARTAEHVASASEELSASATQQATAAETEKGQAAQVGVAMQEMSTTVHEVSENSNRAAQASRQAAETAREGGAIVEDSLGKMRAIAESVRATAQKVEELGRSSDQIGRIIGVIDDIADQTNLLALNAAIEAARAGEQAAALPWSPMKSVSWPSAPPPPPKRSRRWCRPFRARLRPRSWPCIRATNRCKPGCRPPPAPAIP